MGCVICLHLGVVEEPVIQWCCKKNNKIVSDIHSFPDWCPTNDKEVIYDV